MSPTPGPRCPGHQGRGAGLFVFLAVLLGLTPGGRGLRQRRRRSRDGQGPNAGELGLDTGPGYGIISK